jgi:cell wall assembly regulator SMI1
MIAEELQKTLGLLAGTVFDGVFNSPATPSEIAVLETVTGIKVDGGLRELWLLVNGAKYRQFGTPVFGVYTDCTAPCNFMSIQDSIRAWQNLQGQRADWSKYPQESPRDRRIRAGWSDPKWLPFAQFNGSSTVVYYDAHPKRGGKLGQIIAYQHDPDAIYFVAESIDDFFVQSNQLLAVDTNLIQWIHQSAPEPQPQHYPSINIVSGSSTSSFTRTKNCTASRPSTNRWS